jgi:hypothetical protein
MSPAGALRGDSAHILRASVRRSPSFSPPSFRPVEQLIVANCPHYTPNRVPFATKIVPLGFRLAGHFISAWPRPPPCPCAASRRDRHSASTPPQAPPQAVPPPPFGLRRLALRAPPTICFLHLPGTRLPGNAIGVSQYPSPTPRAPVGSQRIIGFHTLRCISRTSGEAGTNARRPGPPVGGPDHSGLWCPLSRRMPRSSRPASRLFEGRSSPG